MSAVTDSGAIGGRGSRPPVRELTPRAWLYCGVVMALAAGVATPLLAHFHASGGQWAAFAVLSSCAAVAQLFTVQTPRNHGFQTTNVFLIPAILLLPAPLVALLALVQHVPEWLNARKAWYVQSFNIANYTLNALAAYAVAHAVERSGLIASTQARDALAGVAAAVVFVVLNHLLLAIMLNLARGYSLLETGLFSFDGLSTDLVLAGLGVGVATFWRLNPWLIPFALAPLVLIHRSLAVPQLQAEARVDPKTGLFNARHFAAALAEELARAERFERPLSLIMADLDLLREINWPATPSSRGSPRSSGPSSATTTCRPASAARSSASCSRRRHRRRRSRSPSGSAAPSPRSRSTSRRRASRSAPPCRSASPASPRTATTPTSSSTRPTSPSTGPSSRAETASSASARRRS